MGFAALRSMRHDDEDTYRLEKGMPEGYEAPEYPGGLSFSIADEDLTRAGGEGGDPREEPVMHFAAMAEVTAVSIGREDCRIELQMKEFAGEDGKFFDLSRPCHICFSGSELEKLDLDTDVERGDEIHLIGTVRLDGRSDNEYMGKEARLQIVELSWEDESTESRGD